MKNKAEWTQTYNDFFKELIKEKKSKEVNLQVQDWLVKTMNEAKNAYYNSGEPIMDDPTYDRFENHLRLLNPDHIFLEKVGSDEKVQTSETEGESAPQTED